MYTVSVTERQNFKRCRRMWRYSSFNQMSLTKIVTKQSLSLGSLIHSSLEQWLLTPDADLLELFKKFSAKELDNIQTKYKEQVGAEISDNELAPFLDGVEIGLSMMKNYRDFWKHPLPTGFTLVAPEQKVNIEVAQGLVIEAKFDGLIANNKGVIFILEHKTYGQRPRIENLNVNDQFLAYIWIAQRLDVGPIGGIAYDGMWKRAVPPRGSTMQDLFIRTELHRTQTELNEFTKFLEQEIADMMWLDGEIKAGNLEVAYTNHRWEGCFDCQFVPLCNAESNDEDTEFIIKNFYSLRERDGEKSEDD